ncbi:DUF882 domain-containing protein [Candidatus Woesearchaeota archaeon]|nr:DUF882 domain-containing protein [Candidatus Woesearchaeota archaeon]
MFDYQSILKGVYASVKERYDAAKQLKDRRSSWTDRKTLRKQLGEEIALLDDSLRDIVGLTKRLSRVHHRLKRQKNTLQFAFAAQIEFLHKISKLLVKAKNHLLREQRAGSNVVYGDLVKREKIIATQFAVVCEQHLPEQARESFRKQYEQQAGISNVTTLLIGAILLSIFWLHRVDMSKETLQQTQPVAEKIAPSAKSSQTEFSYIVKGGENIGIIYNKLHAFTPPYNQFIKGIKKLNPKVDIDTIYPGNEMRIPLKPGAEPPQITHGKYYIKAKTAKEVRQAIAQEHPSVVLARLFMGEAETCSDQAKIAVWDVIKYRMISPDFPHTLVENALKTHQFSCFFDSATLGKIQNPEAYNLNEWQRNLNIASALVSQDRIQSLPVALFYHDNSMDEHGEPYLKVMEMPNGKPNGKFTFYVTRTSKLTEHFSVKEFMCKDGCRNFRLMPELLFKLEALRKRTGKSIKVNSGCRCAVNNAKAGGADDSQHMKGTAADVIIKGMTVPQMAALAEQFGFGGIGIYTDRIHIDTRKGKARWKK